MSDKLLKGAGRIIADPDEIRNSAPVNCDDPSYRASKSYEMISTREILDVFESEGWSPKQMKMRKTRDPEAAATGKHIIRFEHPDYVVKDQGSINLMLRNSHDTTSALLLGMGFFKFACENGLVTGRLLGICARILHKNVNPDSIAKAIGETVGRINDYTGHIDSMSGKMLTDGQASEFARQAALIRWPDAKLKDTASLLQSHRTVDEGNSLWNVYNRVQENATQGNAILLKKGQDEEGKEYIISRKARPLIGAEQDFRFNEDLADLAHTMFLQAAA